MIKTASPFATLALCIAPSTPMRVYPSQSADVPPSALQELHWRFVGPMRAGWATAVTGVPSQPNTYYFGSAGGGVWKTDDAGRTWRGLMQHETAAAVGAIAVSESNPRIIYVGTGQAAARYDMMGGDGVYRSDDGGEHWRNVGLRETKHIGEVLIHPSNPDRVLVAALGHVFGPNLERGVYLTTDGGANWRAVLQVDANTGAVDLAWDPTHPEVVYAAMWQMRQHPWLDYFQPQAGPGSGIYKSEDGGEHWRRLEGGLPTGSLGRIGLAVARGSGGRIAFATVAVNTLPLSTTRVAPGKSGIYRTGDGGATWQLVNDNGELASSYFGRLTIAPNDTDVVYVTGQSIRRLTHNGRDIDVVKGAPGGDDYHDLWINPTNAAYEIHGSDQGAAVTVNGGATWSSWYNQPTGQFYHLATDDRFPYRIYSGQQDNGSVELLSRGPYGVIDERDWHPVGGDERDYMVPKPGNANIVFGSGLGGHVSRFDEITRQVAEISPWPVISYGAKPTTVKYRYTWITPLVFSPVAPHAMYLGAQVLFKSTDDGNHWSVISPDLSGHGSMASATSDSACGSPDLATARQCGFGVIFTINPSPVAQGTIWVGTDDGVVQVTNDDGAHWRHATPREVPLWARINTVEPSPFDAQTAYLAVDTHRLDRFAPLLMKTTDGGATWLPIVKGLPADEYTTVVRADPVKRGLLYAGTNRAVYVSFDDGANWQPLSLNLPNTWMRDLLVHQNDLIVATQGRGIWILDDIASLRELGAAPATEAARLFTPAPAVRLRGDENRDTPWPPDTPTAENPPTGALIDYWLAAPAAGPVTLTIRDSAGGTVRSFSSADTAEKLPTDLYFQTGWLGSFHTLPTAAGMHRWVWDLRYPRPKALHYDYSIAGVWGEGTPLEPRGALAVPGRYTATLNVGGKDYTRPFTITLDPRARVPQSALVEQLRFAQRVASDLERAVAMHGKSGADDSYYADIAGVLANLETAAEGADAAPTEGDRAVLAEYERRLAAAPPRRG